MWGNDRRTRLDTAGERLRVLGPWTGSALRGLAIIVAVTLVLGAYWAWSGRPRAVAVGPSPSTAAVEPSGAPSVDPPATPPATPSPAAVVVVHVVGRVARPGLVTLPAGSRVADAIAAAGGVTRPRAADSVNLARVLADGEQIAVGVDAVAAASTPTTGAVAPIVDLNTADLAALDSLPGVGPVLAGRILAWRQAHGPFRSVDELGEVSGIGDAILGQLRPLVRV
mgnify:CR=1 FL=1